jgi:hypothetical protein
MSTPDESRIQAALEQLDKDDLLALILRLVQQHPDLTGLIVSGEQKAVKKPRKPFNAEVYRLQIEKIFLTTDRNTWGSEARAAEPLLDIVDVADEYVEQGNFNEAAIVHEIIIRGILDNYASFRWHADEGQLDEVVEDCVDGLSDCLRGIRTPKMVHMTLVISTWALKLQKLRKKTIRVEPSRFIKGMLIRSSSGEGETITVPRASISSASAGSTNR